jgi:hypothetical protein
MLSSPYSRQCIADLRGEQAAVAAREFVVRHKRVFFVERMGRDDFMVIIKLAPKR